MIGVRSWYSTLSTTVLHIWNVDKKTLLTERCSFPFFLEFNPASAPVVNHTPNKTPPVQETSSPRKSHLVGRATSYHQSAGQAWWETREGRRQQLNKTSSSWARLLTDIPVTPSFVVTASSTVAVHFVAGRFVGGVHETRPSSSTILESKAAYHIRSMWSIEVLG